MIKPDIKSLADFISRYLQAVHTESLRTITDYSQKHYAELIEKDHVIKALRELEERGEISANWRDQKGAAPLFTYIGT